MTETEDHNDHSTPSNASANASANAARKKKMIFEDLPGMIRVCANLVHIRCSLTHSWLL